MKSAGAAVVGVALLLSAREARAGSLAWTSLQPHTSSTANTVLGLGNAAVTSPLFAQLTSVPGLPFATFLRMKDVCRIDPATAVADLAVVGDDTDSALAVSVKMDAPTFAACLAELATGSATPPAIPTADLPTVLAFKLAGTVIYVGVSRSLVVITSKPADKSTLTKWWAGSGVPSTSALGLAIGKTSTSSALWFASSRTSTVNASYHVSALVGSIDFAGANLAYKFLTTLGSSSEAASAASAVNSQLASLKSSGTVAEPLTTPVATFATSWAGSDVTASWSSTSSELLSLASMMSTRVTVTGTPSGSGSVRATSTSSDASCVGASCSVFKGGSVTLSATAASGSHFASWSGGCAGTSATVTIAPSVATTCTATFATP